MIHNTNLDHYYYIVRYIISESAFAMCVCFSLSKAFAVYVGVESTLKVAAHLSRVSWDGY
jgi:hypothetical protein